MEASTSENLPATVSEADEAESEITSVWQYGQYRLKTLWARPEVRHETAVSLGLLLLLFSPALPGWWQRWTLTGSPQLYSILLFPLALAWVWLSRRRLALPELDAARRSLLDFKAPLRPFHEGGEQEAGVLRVYREEEPFPVKHHVWLLLPGCLFTAFAYWLREPLLTCLGFLTLLGGLVAYRFGTSLLRLVLFPLFFLLALLPVPGMLLDWVNDRLQNLLFGSVLHVLLNVSVNAELAPEGNPLRINPKTPQTYELFAGQAGLGLPESWLVLLVTIWFLSLVRAPARRKLGAVVACGIWMTLLMVLRLLILCWAGAEDKELTGLLEPLTRLLLFAAGIGGQFLILRGFKCQKFQKWVGV